MPTAEATERKRLAKVAHCKRKFLRMFPKGFGDRTYIEWEREYKVETHERWQEVLNETEFARLMRAGDNAEIAARAIRVEQRSRHSMIFSFEKMALRDATRSPDGAEMFAKGLYEFLHGSEELSVRFSRWVDAVGSLPRKQTRVLTWPVLTVFGFIAQPRVHMFLKPNTTRRAAEAYGFDFHYSSKPSWETYQSLLAFAQQVRRDLRDMRPRDMIDIQSFMWVQGSTEYE